MKYISLQEREMNLFKNIEASHFSFQFIKYYEKVEIQNNQFGELGFQNRNIDN